MHVHGQLRPKPSKLMLRRLLRRHGVSAHRCVLVEDTLQHQKAARSIGMRTAWVMRYVRARAAPLRPRAGRPAYVDRRLPALRALTHGIDAAVRKEPRGLFQ
jgi:putative hydrolase of the HAD superfamily